MWFIYWVKGVLVAVVAYLLVVDKMTLTVVPSFKGAPPEEAVPAVMARVMAYGDACLAGRRGFSLRYPPGRKRSDGPGLPMKEIPPIGFGPEPPWMVPDFERMSEVEQYLELRRRRLEEVESELRRLYSSFQHAGWWELRYQPARWSVVAAVVVICLFVAY